MILTRRLSEAPVVLPRMPVIQPQMLALLSGAAHCRISAPLLWRRWALGTVYYRLARHIRILLIGINVPNKTKFGTPCCV